MHKIYFVAGLIILMVACAPESITSAASSGPGSDTTEAEAFSPTSTETNMPEIAISPTSTLRPPDQVLYAPSGEFIARFDHAYSHPASEKQAIEILNKDGSLLWEIPYQGEISRSDPHPSLSIYGWSKDSSTLYFYYVFSPDGGDMAFWWDGFNLQSIDVKSGIIKQVIPREGFVAFAFSPDESQLAFTRAEDNPSIIYIRNLSSAAEKTAYVIFSSRNYLRVGDIVWSPSGTEIAFQTEANDYMVQTIYLNVSTMKQKLIREYKLEDLFFHGWTTDGQLEFFESGNIVHVNVQNSETTIIGTRTPRPK